MTKRNYNRLALQGLDIDDMDFIQDFNLDPSLAYTPKINDAMLDLMYEQNVNNFMKYDNMPRPNAQAKAGRLRKEVRMQIDDLLR